MALGKKNSHFSSSVKFIGYHLVKSEIPADNQGLDLPIAFFNISALLWNVKTVAELCSEGPGWIIVT